MNDLYQPSLTPEENYNTKSYDLNKLFFVAFFGGVLPTAFLGVRCAKWLRSSDYKRKLIFGAAILGLVAKIIIFGSAFDWTVSSNIIPLLAEQREIRWVSRAIAVAIFFVILYLLKEDFRTHVLNGNGATPILMIAIIVILLGGLLEDIIVFGGVYLIGLFI